MTQIQPPQDTSAPQENSPPPPRTSSESAGQVSPGPSMGRLVGLDLARALAVFGMYIVHIAPMPSAGNDLGSWVPAPRSPGCPCSRTSWGRSCSPRSGPASSAAAPWSTCSTQPPSPPSTSGEVRSGWPASCPSRPDPPSEARKRIALAGLGCGPRPTDLSSAWRQPVVHGRGLDDCGTCVGLVSARPGSEDRCGSGHSGRRCDSQASLDGMPGADGAEWCGDRARVLSQGARWPGGGPRRGCSRRFADDRLDPRVGCCRQCRCASGRAGGRPACSADLLALGP